MKAVLQRVQYASVTVDGQVIGKIDRGLLVFLGVEKTDTKTGAARLVERILGYRIFADKNDKMNLSVQQAGGGVLVISQFTLVADTSSGTRPGFSLAADPEQALSLYAFFLDQLSHQHEQVQSGKFAADMQVSLLNDGPVTFLLEVC